MHALRMHWERSCELLCAVDGSRAAEHARKGVAVWAQGCGVSRTRR